MHASMHVCMYGSKPCAHVRMYGCTNACMDGWMDGWMDGCVQAGRHACICVLYNICLRVTSGNITSISSHIKPYHVSHDLQHILPQWHPTSCSEHPPKESCDLAPCGQHIRTVVCVQLCECAALWKVLLRCIRCINILLLHLYTTHWSCIHDTSTLSNHSNTRYILHYSIRVKPSWLQPLSFGSVESGHSDWLAPETPIKRGMLPMTVLRSLQTKLLWISWKNS